MKSLQTIQKVFHVFYVLTRVALILNFVGAGLVLLGLICGVVYFYYETRARMKGYLTFG